MPYDASMTAKCGLSHNQKLLTTIEGAMAGDVAAFTALTRQYAPHILFNVKTRIDHPEAAEDVAQEIALQMYRTIGNLQTPFAFRSWLQRIIVNMCANYNNRDARKNYDVRLDRVEELESPVAESSPDDLVEDDDRRSQLYQMILRLPDRQRECVVMHYYDEMSYHEIAETLGIADGTVSSAIGKAKDNLRKQLRYTGALDYSGAGSAAFAGVIFSPALVSSALQQGAARVVPDQQVHQLCAAVEAAVRGAGGVGTGVIAAAQALKSGHTKLLRALMAATVALAVLGGAGYLIARLMEPPSVAPAAASARYDPDASVALSGDRTLVLSIRDSSRVVGWELRDSGTGKRIATGDGTEAGAPQAAGSYEVAWKLVSPAGLSGQIAQSFDVQ